MDNITLYAKDLLLTEPFLFGTVVDHYPEALFLGVQDDTIIVRCNTEKNFFHDYGSITYEDSIVCDRSVYVDATLKRLSNIRSLTEPWKAISSLAYGTISEPCCSMLRLCMQQNVWTLTDGFYIQGT